MPKLNLNRAFLDELFEHHIPTREIRLRKESDGTTPTTLNTQQLYNGQKDKWNSSQMMAWRPNLNRSLTR